MAKVALSNAEVELIDNLTWGQQEQLRGVILSGMKMSMKREDAEMSGDVLMAAKYKALELCIVSITEDGKETKYSKAWVDNLSVADGDKLMDAVDAITNPEKK